MIQILGTSNGYARFSLLEAGLAEDLPIVSHLLTLKVVSWSMFPTIRKGDLIEIEPAASPQVGDVVVFRSGNALVCHRVAGVLSSQEILTRGDGSTEADHSVRREDLVGKVAAIIRRGQRQDPHFVPVATLVSMLRLHSDQFFGRLQAWIVAEGLGLWQRLKCYSIIQRFSAYILMKNVKFSVGVRASIGLMHAYRCYALSGYPVKDEILERLPSSFTQSQDLILLAHLGPYRLGMFQPASGQLTIRRSVTGLGLEDWFLDLGARVRQWSSSI